MDSQPKKTRRKLSRFLCQEMLYDYVSDNLDPDRREAIREFLASDEQSREELECLREGLSYSDSLSKTTVSLPLLEKMKRAESIPVKALSRLSWSQLPAPLRLGIEALGVSMAVAVIVSSIPWGRLQWFRGSKSGQIEIAQIERNKMQDGTNAGPSEGTPTAESAPDRDAKPVDVAVATNDAEEDESPAPAPTTVAHTTAPIAPVPVAPPPPAVKPPPVPVKPPDPIAKSEPPAKPVGANFPLPGKASSLPPSAALGPGATEEDPSNKGTPANAKGYIFKVFMRLPNLDQITPKVADALRGQGAERAGEVELGWRRATGSYFHFTLPEDNYETSIKALQAFGPVRIFREPHRRVMPQGKIRFILWIEDDK